MGSIADCFKKAGKALDAKDKQKIEALIADGVADIDAVEQTILDIDKELNELAQKAKKAGATLQYEDVTDTAEENKTRMQKFWAAVPKQPIDRLFRIPFDVAGLVDSHGRMKGSQVISEKASYVIKEWRPHGDKFEWLDGFIEKSRHGLIDRYKLTDDYKRTFREAEALGRNIDMQALDILKKMEESGVDGAEAAVLHKMLSGEEIADNHLQHLSQPILEAIDELGLMAVEYDVITREQFERNRYKYLHRSYLKHEGSFNSVGKWLMDKRTAKMRKIEGKASKGRGIQRTVTMARLLKHVPTDWYGIKQIPNKPDLNHLNQKKFVVLENPGVDPTYSQTLDGVATQDHTTTKETIYWPADLPMPNKYRDYRNKGTFEVRGKKKGNVVLWRDYTKAERENMGEIIDARYNIAKTFTVLSHDIAMGKFFQDISKNDDWFQKELPDDAVRLTAREASSMKSISQTDWVEVPTSTITKSAGTKQWGALAGGYVRSEIWRDLNELDRIQNPKSWQKYMTQWKLNKTARSPVVHMNNVMSNIMFMDMADVRMTDLVNGIMSYKNRDEHWRKAQEHGAFEGTFANEELRREVMEPILEDLMKQSLESGTDEITSMGKFVESLWRTWKKVDRKMLNAYQIEDELFRMATYMRRRDLGDTEEAAAMIARTQFLDYDIRAPWVNTMRRSWLPFIAYTYRAVPVISKAIVERPWKIAKYITLSHAAISLAYLLSPGDEEEEYKTLREDQQGKTWLGTPRMMRLWKDEYGNPVFIDVRRYIPAGDIFDTNQGQLALPWIPSPLQFGGPLMMAGEFMLNKQAFTGQEITKETDTGLEKAGKTADWIYKSWMPSAAYIPGSWYWDKIWTAWEGGQDRMGRPLDTLQAAASSVGIKIQSHDVRQGRANLMFGLELEKRSIDADMRKAQRQVRRNLISKAEFNKIMASSKKKLKRLQERARDLR